VAVQQGAVVLPHLMLRQGAVAMHLAVVAARPEGAVMTPLLVVLRLGAVRLCRAAAAMAAHWAGAVVMLR
jgi:hypothetical protein